MVFLVSYNRKDSCLPFLIQRIKNGHTVVRSERQYWKKVFLQTQDWYIFTRMLRSTSLTPLREFRCSFHTATPPGQIFQASACHTRSGCGLQLALAGNEYFSAATGCCRASWRGIRSLQEKHGFQWRMDVGQSHLWDKKSQKSATLLCFCLNP